VELAHNVGMIRPEELFAPKREASSLDAPLTHLMACHRRIEQRLETMELAAKHLEDRRAEAREAFESAFRFMDSSGVLHTADEEESLFPRLRPKLEPGERTYLAGLEHDHTEAYRLYMELKSLVAADAPAERVKNLVERFAALYRGHIASEDDVLQRYAEQHLDAALLAEIAAEMKQRRGR
jgi:hemerythrin-like domain-containing protein